MKKILKSLSVTGTFAAVMFLSQMVLAFDNDAISMQAKKTGNKVDIEFSIKHKFGIQKEGPHELEIYSLGKNFEPEGNLTKAFKQYGKAIYKAKPLKLQGQTSKDDNEYFSAVNPVSVPAAAGKTGIRARIFYCSFADHFCSVKTLYSILD